MSSLKAAARGLANWASPLVCFVSRCHPLPVPPFQWRGAGTPCFQCLWLGRSKGIQDLNSLNIHLKQARLGAEQWKPGSPWVCLVWIFLVSSKTSGFRCCMYFYFFFFKPSWLNSGTKYLELGLQSCLQCCSPLLCSVLSGNMLELAVLEAWLIQ